MLWVGADRADLREPWQAQSFARHCYQRSIFSGAEIVSHLPCTACERAGFGQLGQRQHLRNVILAQLMEHHGLLYLGWGAVVMEHLQQGQGSHDFPVSRRLWISFQKQAYPLTLVEKFRERGISLIGRR